MVGRFTARRATTSEPLPTEEPTALEGVSWTVFPETGGEQGAAAPQTESPLLSDKLLDAKVRLHRRLIEEINLSALDKASSSFRNMCWSSAFRSTHRN
jgi:pilus assembly protein CpaF